MSTKNSTSTTTTAASAKGGRALTGRAALLAKIANVNEVGFIDEVGKSQRGGIMLRGFVVGTREKRAGTEEPVKVSIIVAESTLTQELDPEIAQLTTDGLGIRIGVKGADFPRGRIIAPKPKKGSFGRDAAAAPAPAPAPAQAPAPQAASAAAPAQAAAPAPAPTDDDDLGEDVKLDSVGPFIAGGGYGVDAAEMALVHETLLFAAVYVGGEYEVARFGGIEFGKSGKTRLEIGDAVVMSSVTAKVNAYVNKDGEQQVRFSLNAGEISYDSELMATRKVGVATTLFTPAEIAAKARRGLPLLLESFTHEPISAVMQFAHTLPSKPLSAWSTGDLEREEAAQRVQTTHLLLLAPSDQPTLEDSEEEFSAKAHRFGSHAAVFSAPHVKDSSDIDDWAPKAQGKEHRYLRCDMQQNMQPFRYKNSDDYTLPEDLPAVCIDAQIRLVHAPAVSGIVEAAKWADWAPHYARYLRVALRARIETDRTARSVFNSSHGNEYVSGTVRFQPAFADKPENANGETGHVPSVWSNIAWVVRKYGYPVSQRFVEQRCVKPGGQLVSSFHKSNALNRSTTAVVNMDECEGRFVLFSRDYKFFVMVCAGAADQRATLDEARARMGDTPAFTSFLEAHLSGKTPPRSTPLYLANVTTILYAVRDDAGVGPDPFNSFLEAPLPIVADDGGAGGEEATNEEEASVVDDFDASLDNELDGAGDDASDDIGSAQPATPPPPPQQQAAPPAPSRKRPADAVSTAAKGAAAAAAAAVPKQAVKRPKSAAAFVSELVNVQ